MLNLKQEVLVSKKLEPMIKRHEGFKNRIYRDTVGVLTIGWGHALLEHSTMPPSVLEALYSADLDEAWAITEQLIKSYNVPDIGLARKFVLVDMAFNLGYMKLMQFKKMWAALAIQDYDTAAIEMLNSKWAQQVKSRSTELADLMRRGVYSND